MLITCENIAQMDHNNKIPQESLEDDRGGAVSNQLFGYIDDQEKERKVDVLRLYNNTFDPFKGQRAFLYADRIKRANARFPEIPAINKVTGFQSCDRFALESNLNESPTAVPVNEEPHLDILDVEITDSEILDACVNAEQQFFQKKEIPCGAPNDRTNKSIVESILEDFCSSPEPVCSTNTTPSYAFNYRKTIRTYANNVRHGKKLELVSPTSSSRQCQSRPSSCLSLQEQLETVENCVATVDLNQSQNLCNNLLNLSAYFSDQPIETDVNSQPSPMPTKQQFNNIAGDKQNEVVQESEEMRIILDLKRKFRVSKRSLYSECFYGFSDDSEQDSSDRCDDSLANNMNIRPQINTDFCDDPTYGKDTVPENTVNYFQIDDRDFRDIKKEKIDEQDLFSENDDMWNEDNEFFMHFKTQNALKGQVSPVYNRTNHIASLLDSKKQNVKSTALCCGTSSPLIGFQTASGEKIAISKEASEYAAKLLKTFEDVEEKIFIESMQPNIERMDANANRGNIEPMQPDIKRMEATFTPKTILMNEENAKPLSVNLEMKVEEGSGLQRNEHVKPGFQTTPKCAILEENLRADTKGPEKYSLLKGFQTAAGKNINVSKDAIDRATNIFQKLADSIESMQPDIKRMEATFTPKTILTSEENAKPLSVNLEMKVEEGSALQRNEHVQPGFQTTPKCAILEENLRADTKGPEKYSLLKGFQTAAGKNINVSKDAIDRATNIFQKLADSEDDLTRTSDIKQTESSMKKCVVTVAPNKLLPAELKRPAQFEEAKIPTYRDVSDKTTIALDAPHCQPLETESVILRKNLLTLNKSKKVRNQSIRNLKTGIKMCALSSTHASPKIKKFNDCILAASTPNTLYPSACPNTGTTSTPIPHEGNFGLQHWNNSKTPTGSKESAVVLKSTSKKENCLVNNDIKTLLKSTINHLPTINQETPPPIILSKSNSCRISGLRRKRVPK